MSSDIYIDLRIVLTHPEHFAIRCEHNDSVQAAAEYVKGDDPDYYSAEMALKPVLMCKFGARKSWRYVEVMDEEFHVSCGGSFRTWLMEWLHEHNYQYTII